MILSNRDLAAANGFLVDLFYYGGLLGSNDTSMAAAGGLGVRRSDFREASAKKACILLCDEIKNRTFNFFKADDALAELATKKFYADSKVVGNVRGTRKIQRPAEVLAAYIANFCKNADIYWDDIHTNRTVYEMDSYKKTLLGGALWDYGCFLSQTLNNSAPPVTANAPAPAGGRTRAVSTRQPGQPPANQYKASGPQSGNVRDLIGQPNQKIQASQRDVLCITGDNANSSSPAFALIRPLEKSGASGNTNKVFISSSHGYTACQCYFEDMPTAQAFLVECQKICPANISNLHIAKRSRERNGYFKVGTEFGIAVLISAQKMNEAINNKHESVFAGREIQDIDTYSEAFYRYE